MSLFGEIRLEIADGSHVRVSTGCVYRVSMECEDVFDNSEYQPHITDHDIYVTEVCNGDANWFAGYSYQVGDIVIVTGRYTKSLTPVLFTDSKLSYQAAALELLAELTHALNKSGYDRPLHDRQRNMLLVVNDTMDIICRNRLGYYPHELSIFGDQIIKVEYGQLKKRTNGIKYGFNFKIKCYIRSEDMPAKHEMLNLPFIEKLETECNPFTNEGEYGVIADGTSQAMAYFDFETEEWKNDIHFLLMCIQSINSNSSTTRALLIEPVMKYDCDHHQLYLELVIKMECEGHSRYSEIRKYVESIIKRLEEMALRSLCDSLERIIIRDESELPF